LAKRELLSFRIVAVTGICYDGEMIELTLSGDGARLKMLEGISWVIVGGESGQHPRAMQPSWARSIRDQCAAAKVAFVFKQWGGELLPSARLRPTGSQSIMKAKLISIRRKIGCLQVRTLTLLSFVGNALLDGGSTGRNTTPFPA
jgi:hypothetical protein